MEKAKHYLIALLSGVLVAATVLSGCGHSQKAVSKNDEHLTVYLWENSLIKNIAPYIQEQFPDQDIEFIIGNNDTDLYSYFEEHGDLPDIITVRRFSVRDVQDLQPYLMDFASSLLHRVFCCPCICPRQDGSYPLSRYPVSHTPFSST